MEEKLRTLRRQIEEIISAILAGSRGDCVCCANLIVGALAYWLPNVSESAERA